MFLKLFILNILFLSISWAEVIKVQSHKANFELTISTDQNIFIKGYQINMSLIKNECNEKIIQDFIGKTKLLIKTKPMSKSREKGLIKITIDDRDYYENPKSRTGYNFISIPGEIQRMKIQEEMLCSKK